MKEIGSREFQISYQRLTEPVKVITRAGGQKTLGYFYPGDVPPNLGSQPVLALDELPASPAPKPASTKRRTKAATPTSTDDLEDII